MCFFSCCFSQKQFVSSLTDEELSISLDSDAMLNPPASHSSTNSLMDNIPPSPSGSSALGYLLNSCLNENSSPLSVEAHTSSNDLSIVSPLCPNSVGSSSSSIPNQVMTSVGVSFLNPSSENEKQ